MSPMFYKMTQGTRIAYNLCEYLADDESDVKLIPKCAMGSTVYVIHNKEKYMMDSHGVWYPTVGDGEPIVCDCVDESTIWENIPSV